MRHDKPMEMRLRNASNQDAQEATSFIERILSDYGLSMELEGHDSDLRDIEATYFVAGGSFEILEDADGKIIGLVAVRPKDRITCELRRLYLAPNLRGKGLGARLLQHALVNARRSGFMKMELVTATALKEAISLYARFCFEAAKAVCGSCCDQAFSLDLTTLNPDSMSTYF
jgi:N-acetylglutamate synthase-like GNAT family acetyltransferase